MAAHRQSEQLRLSCIEQTWQTASELMQPVLSGSPSLLMTNGTWLSVCFGEFCTQQNKLSHQFQILRADIGTWNRSLSLVVIFSCYFPKLLFADSLRVGFYFDVLLSFKSLVVPPVIFRVLQREEGREKKKKRDVVIMNVFGQIIKSRCSLKMRNHGNLNNTSHTYYTYLTMCKVHLEKRN